MARIGKPIQLTMEQRAELLTMSRSHKLERRYVERAKIILCSDQGMLLDEIVKYTGLSRPVVNKWRQRFRKNGIPGLRDAARSGKPKTITPEQKALVIEKACIRPKGGYTNWSQERIAKEIGISQSKVFQILKQADLKPHKIEYQYASKLSCTLYHQFQPSGALRLCLEKRCCKRTIRGFALCLTVRNYLRSPPRKRRSFLLP